MNDIVLYESISIFTVNKYIDLITLYLTDLCGTEIEAGYPHNERNSGTESNKDINHFPDGVFHKCRVILYREREVERKRMKRLKRMNRHSPVKRHATITPFEEIQLEVVTPKFETTNPTHRTAYDYFEDSWRPFQQPPEQSTES